LDRIDHKERMSRT